MGMRIGLGEKRQEELSKELKRIVAEIKELGVLKIILFGSMNEHNVGKSSDIDIAIIKETKENFSERLDELYTTIQPRVAVDFFVYTPKEIELLKTQSHFIRRMLKRGRVLYEA